MLRVLTHKPMNTMHARDYKKHGGGVQFGEVDGMMYIEHIAMETIFGDGSSQNSGFMGALLGGLSRVLDGDNS